MNIKTADGMTSNVASQGLGGTALGIGIGALGLSALQGMNGGNGLLGGLFGGGNNNQQANLLYELAREKSERYADSIGLQAYKGAVELTSANADKINALDKKIAVMEANTAAGLATLNANFNCLQNVVSNITKTVVPNSAICPGWGTANVTVSTATTTA